jgi:hypothetical protein
MATDFSPDALKKHFHALSAKRAKVDEKLDPLRRELNDIVAGKGASAKLTHAQAVKREAEVRADIVKLQAQLAPIESERATVARALNGQTGLPEGITFGHSL